AWKRRRISNLTLYNTSVRSSLERRPTARSVVRNIATRSVTPLRGRPLCADAAALLPAPARRQASPRVAVAAHAGLPRGRRVQPGPVGCPGGIVRPPAGLLGCGRN